MRTIWKYPVKVAAEFTIPMPRNAEVLTVQLQNGEPVMWALVDTDEPAVNEMFYIAGTGRTAPDEESIYCGTFQIEGFVWHLFRRVMAPTGSTPPRGQHTPGPWLIEYAETGMRWPVIYVEDEAWDGGRREIAQISGHIAKRGKDDRWRKTPDAEESEATARLIALAPELYDLVAYVATHRCQHPESPGDCHYCAARALIRRAGETAAKPASVEEARP